MCPTIHGVYRKWNSQHKLKSEKPYEIGSTVSYTAIQAIDNTQRPRTINRSCFKSDIKTFATKKKTLDKEMKDLLIKIKSPRKSDKNIKIKKLSWINGEV